MTNPAFSRASLDALRWLVGEWRGESEGREFVERWSPPANGAMAGEGRAGPAGHATFTERLRLESRANGAVVYVASPSGQATAEFTLTALTHVGDTREAIFENPAHDFPTRIVYRLTAPDALVAAIEGPGPSGPRRVEFRMRRVAP